MKKHIPKILIYSRFFMACAILSLVLVSIPQARYMVLVLMYLGIITDIFDGIIARKFNISTVRLRVQDTFIDLVFYISIVLFVTKIYPEIIMANSHLLAIIFGLELLMYLVSLFRFKKLPSPHAVLSKFWGIYIIIELTLLLLSIGGVHFTIALLVGIAVHTDRVLIYLFLRTWNHDIPSCYHACQLRQGKEIKRLKIFNG